ncbi:MAG: TadE/TadG family type IV pilus assembly protein [Cypionkella sp.]
MTTPIPTPVRTMADAADAKPGFLSNDDGTTLVEFAIVMPIFLMLFFGLIDFGRLGFEYVMANKAMQLAARIAVARPPACPGVPTTNVRGPVAAGTIPPYFGSNCRSAANVCANPGTFTCAGSAANASVAEIWPGISILLPKDATPANLKFSYAYNSDLGFLGGPYEPMVTVSIQNLRFQFVTPLGALAVLAGAAGGLPTNLPFPTMSVSLPAEDLALGEDG